MHRDNTLIDPNIVNIKFVLNPCYILQYKNKVSNKRGKAEVNKSIENLICLNFYRNKRKFLTILPHFSLPSQCLRYVKIRFATSWFQKGTLQNHCDVLSVIRLQNKEDSG